MEEIEIKISDLHIFKDLFNELDIEVETPYGYHKILAYDITSQNTATYTVETENKKIIEVSQDHLFKNDLNNFVTIVDILKNLDMKIQTKDGLEKILFVTYNFDKRIDLVDIQVEGVGQYYGNNYLLHNSNILNAITYGLHGQTLDTRKKQVNRDNNFINHNNDKDYAEVSLEIEINSELFLITRRTERKWNRKKDEITSVSTKVTYNKINDISLTDQKKGDTQKLIEESIGNFESMITNVLVNADTLNEILTINHSDFLDTILQYTGYDIFEKKLSVFKNYIKNEYKKETKININIDNEIAKIDSLENELIEKENEVVDLNNKIEEFEKRIGKGNDVITELRSTLKPIDSEVSKIDINLLNNDISLLLSEKKNRQDDMSNIQNSIDQLAKFQYDNIAFDKLVVKSSGFNKWLYENKTIIKEKENTINQLKNDIAKINGIIYNKNNEIKFIDTNVEFELEKLKKSIIDLEKENNLLENSKTCPTCQQLKTTESIKSLLLLINDNLNKIKNIQNIIDSGSYKQSFETKKLTLNDEIKKHNEEIVIVQNEISEFENQIKLIKNKIDTETLEISLIDEEIFKIKIIIEEINRRNKLIKDLENLPLLIENISMKIQLKNELLTKYNNNIEFLKLNIKINEKIDLYIDALNKLVSQKNELEKKISIIKHIDIVNINNKIIEINQLIKKFLEQQKIENIRNEYERCIHRDGIPSILLKKLIPRMNQYMEHYLEDLDFIVFFDDDLNFLMTKKEKENIQSVISGSGMERVFACICLRLALRFINNQSKSNILLLDELFGKLSEKNAYNFVNLMNKIKQDIEKIIIIEHAHSDVINPDHLVLVEKNEEGNSFINIQY